MSDVIDIPLWNKAQDDILPKHQLTYGHILCQVSLTTRAIQRLARFLGFGKMVYHGPIDFNRLPVASGTQYRTLGHLDDAHLIVGQYDQCYFVYAPHRLFFHSGKWIKWNWWTGGLMAYAGQLDINYDQHFRIFRKGKYKMFGIAEGDRLRFPDEPNITATLDGKVIYSQHRGPVQAQDAIIALLRSEVVLQEIDGSFCFNARFSGENLAPERFIHYAFGNYRPWWWLW